MLLVTKALYLIRELPNTFHKVLIGLPVSCDDLSNDRDDLETVQIIKPKTNKQKQIVTKAKIKIRVDSGHTPWPLHP